MIFSKRTNRRGAWTVEAAIVLPIFVLLLFGIFEYARFLFTVEMLNQAAREGARYAVTNITTASTTQVQAYVDHYLAGQGVQLQGYSPSGNIQVYQVDPLTGNNNSLGWQTARWGSPVAVQISGTYSPLLGKLLFMGNSIAVQGKCIMVSEAN